MERSSFILKALAVSLMLVSATAMANTKGYKGETDLKCEAPAPCCPTCPVSLMDGFYVGLGLGYDNYRVRQNFDLSETGLGTPFLNGNPPISVNGWTPQLFLGYGKNMSDAFYLGAEVFIDTSNAEASYNVSDTTFNYSSKIEAELGYGVALLPGIKLNCTTLGYLRLGYNWVRMEYKQNMTDNNLDTRGSSSNTDTVHGFSYGIGMETLLNCNWSLRGEYIHTNYSSSHSGLSVIGSQGLAPPPTTILDSSYDPSDNQYMLSLIFHFA